MADNVNKVILVGNLGADPVVRNFPVGGRVCEFRLATTESWKDRTSGERKERTQWHNISIYTDGLIVTAERFLRKGYSVYVEGQLEYRVYQDNAGQDRYWTEVALRS